MSVKKGYNRYFIIFQEEDKGYGIAIDKQPTGYAKIEVKNGKCKITVYAQNIKKEKGPYNFCMIDTNKSPANLVKLGEVRIDDVGTGETFWEYNEDDVCNSGRSVENYNVAVLLADEEANSAPLSGYTGKERVLWKDKIHTHMTDDFDGSSRNATVGSFNKQASSNEKLDLNDEMIEELDEEGMKFKEYEASIRSEADRMRKGIPRQERLEESDPSNLQDQNEYLDHSNIENDSELNMDKDTVRHKKDSKGYLKHEHGHKHDSDEDKHDHNCYDNNDHSHDDYSDSDSANDNHEHNHDDYENDSDSHEHNHDGYYYYSDSHEHNHDDNHDDYSDSDSHDHNSDDYEHNHDSSYSPDCMHHKHKKNETYADIFHYLLNEFEEVSENFTEHEMDKTRWWKIPYRYEAKLINEEHYPFMCTIFHLSMAYPHVDYIKYFYKTGHYYFGIKYDENNEVKYLMYGIVGGNSMKEQPHMGVTGFNKWVGKQNKEMGVWIMFYNPKTGNIMIEQNR